MSILKIRNGDTGAWEAIRCVEVEGPSGVPEFVRQEAQRLAGVVQRHQNANTISFLVCSDLHYSKVYNSKAQTEAMTHMGQAMKLLCQTLHIDFAAMLGDMIWDAGEDRAGALEEIRFVNQCLGEGIAEIPNLRCRGNHDHGGDCGANLSDGQIFANIGKFNTGGVYGDRLAGYCYRDFEGVRVRVICLNSSEGGGCQLSAEQVAWLEEVLRVPEGWRTLVLSHHPLDWGKSGGVSPIDALAGAEGLICCVHGHIHNFKVGTVTGTDIPRIAIPNGCVGLENGYKVAYDIDWSEPAAFPKVAESGADTAFCVVTVDLEAKKIYADHYGAGYDRIVGFDGVQLAEFAVQARLTNVTQANPLEQVTEGVAYDNTLRAEAGYVLDSLTVTMGGEDITAWAVKDGRVSIEAVTGDVVITATAIGKDQVNYTNLVETLEDTDSEAIFNECGYLNGSYASGTGTGTDDRCVVTGLLPYDYTGGVRTPIYIKGCTLDTGNNRVRILGFNSVKQCYFQSASGGALPVYFEIETLGADYYRVTPMESIAGAGAEIRYLRFSLVGRGENLVITLNEPIG